MTDNNPEPIEPDPAAEPDEATADLVAYLDGELDPLAAEAIEARMGQDPNARAEADTLKRTWDLLDYLPRTEPSQSFTARTMERIEPLGRSATASAAPTGAGTSGQRPRWRLRVVVGWAAALIAAVAAGWFLQPTARSRLFPNDDKAIDVADLRILENLKLYRHVDDLQFLRDLDTPDLFGEDAGGQ